MLRASSSLAGIQCVLAKTPAVKFSGVSFGRYLVKWQSYCLTCHYHLKDIQNMILFLKLYKGAQKNLPADARPLSLSTGNGPCYEERKTLHSYILYVHHPRLFTPIFDTIPFNINFHLDRLRYKAVD
ncbi:hypothetical protein TNCV_109151 [Trichonephila clavipes]|nr:hypothetical protein TNCV_109151 [Trichonephila clavipes]